MEKLLTKFKSIKPSEEFRQLSKAAIFSSLQNQKTSLFIFENFRSLFSSRIALSGVALAALLMAIFPILNNLRSPALTSNLDPEKLTNESKSLDIQIQLSQAQYYEDSAKKIEVALAETSDERGANFEKDLNALLEELTL